MHSTHTLSFFSRSWTSWGRLIATIVPAAVNTSLDEHLDHSSQQLPVLAYKLSTSARLCRQWACLRCWLFNKHVSRGRVVHANQEKAWEREFQTSMKCQPYWQGYRHTWVCSLFSALAGPAVIPAEACLRAMTSSQITCDWVWLGTTCQTQWWTQTP